MANPLDLTGAIFGRLTCISRAEDRKNIKYWNTLCSCGTLGISSVGNLRKGNIKSCGCLGKDTRDLNRLKLVDANYGRLTLMSEVAVKKGRHYWLAQCACGNTIEVAETNVKNGTVKSCGCLQKEMASTANFKHGKSRLYNNGETKNDTDGSYGIWQDIHKRCTNTKFKDWKYYGGKGIKVCPEWSDYLVFAKDMGIRPHNYSIERKDGNKDYCAENCYWATSSEQGLNRAGHSLWKPVVINGVSYPFMLRASNALGINIKKIKQLNEAKNAK